MFGVSKKYLLSLHFNIKYNFFSINQNNSFEMYE